MRQETLHTMDEGCSRLYLLKRTTKKETFSVELLQCHICPVCAFKRHNKYITADSMVTFMSAICKAT